MRFEGRVDEGAWRQAAIGHPLDNFIQGLLLVLGVQLEDVRQWSIQLVCRHHL